MPLSQIRSYKKDKDKQILMVQYETSVSLQPR